ncbi:glutamine synthetase family protein [Flexivirga caeni]|uniref:Glutamine synthetase n=1 Tax=Flexivirga caeni TaxID=2294115 RepID=A0A3M9M0K7_9MICO|nr:glutamine synthetase family protein [Flexivirga caeni]RNI18413.1 glutamine synthetase [Flexivirga caeni]
MKPEEYIEKFGRGFATVALADTNGLLRGQLVSSSSLAGILRDGMGMAPATLALDPTDEFLTLPGVTDASADFHDDFLKVDPDSARRVPWAEDGRDLLLLATYSGEAAQLCPRSLLGKVLATAANYGYAPRYGIELEYTLFDETAESARAKNYHDLRTATAHKSHDLVIYQVHQSDWYGAVADMCEALRIDLSKMHEEIGGGFMEACTAPGEGLEPADQLVLLKNFLRILAMRRGKTVCFMPRWNEDADSQSSHVHMSLLDSVGNPVFHDAGDIHGTSRAFIHFLGGLRRYLGELSLLFLPTVNSYRRFAPGTFAPSGLTWGYENRTACLRVVGHDDDTLRVENRLAGADANPYLIVAAMVAAGTAGIIEELDPGEPITGNGYEQNQEGPGFARSMPEAIERMRGSTFARDWFGDAFVDGFAATRQSQLDTFAAKVPDVELERFFDLG